MTSNGSQTQDSNEPIRLQIVGAGNGWWVNTGPNPADIATYVFVDAGEHPELLELPDRVQREGWSTSTRWSSDRSVLLVAVCGSPGINLELLIDRPELEAVRRSRTLYICPTTPKLGLSPFLARDRSFPVPLSRVSDA